MTRTTTWWERATIYHVYPRSLQDSDGDGVGDLAGITRRLPDLVDLGIDTVWLSPVYRSPMADFGYDITDHCDVDPLFGTMADLDELIATAHDLGLRIVLDFVPNHTSDQHHWFIESRSSRDHPRRNWYVWSDPAPEGGPPTNWRSEFGGPAWTLDEPTGQYYYHAYLREQPNLNWHEPGVRAAMFDVMRFWLDRGVDGFRLDAFRRLFVNRDFVDEPDNPDYRPEIDNESFAVLPIHTSERAELFDHVTELRREIDRLGDHVLLGEIYLDIVPLMRYYGTADEPGLHLPGNFNLLWTSWTAADLGDLLRTYEAVLPEHGWPNWVLGNHDRSRIASRVGQAQARVAAMFLLMARGTPTIYMGDEIGMRDVPIPPEQVQDPWERNVPGRGFGRDPVRTPMQWDSTPTAGFSDVEPWLPLADDAATCNVEVQRGDPTSMWTLHHRLLALRRREPALHAGAVNDIEHRDGILSFVRTDGQSSFRVVLEMSGTESTFDLGAGSGTIVLSTRLVRTPSDSAEAVAGSVGLAADEGVVIALDPT